MAENVPPWLTGEFLASVIQDGDLTKPHVVVKDFTVKLAVGKGNNYMSTVYRVRARYTKEEELIGVESAKISDENLKTAALIIKAPITTGVVVEFQEKMNIMEVEPKMYAEVLPKINEMLGCQLTPKMFFCPLKNGLALADLSADGYSTCDKRRQLDFAHCESALSALGRIHAASVRLRRDSPELLVGLDRERIWRDEEADESAKHGERQWLIGGVTAVAAIAASLPDCQDISKYLLSRAEGIRKSLIEICKERSDRLNVLNHGDLWINNILYKHDKHGNVEDIKLIDFQIIRWSTPALDVLYFIWTSANEESRSRIQDLLSSYLQSLNDTLDILGCEERLSKKELESEMKASSDWVVLAVSCLLPMIMAEADDALDMSSMTKEEFEGGEMERSLSALYRGKNYNAVIPALFRQLQQWILA